MPFDGTHFIPPPPERRARPATDKIATVLIVGFASLLLLTPISLAALADIVQALRHP